MHSDLKLSSSSLSKSQSVDLEVTFTNAGSLDGAEVVQLYVLDQARSVTPPEKELKGFQKLMLKAGESKTIKFTITESMLRFFNADLKHISEPGMFTVMVGGNSKELLTKDIELK